MVETADRKLRRAVLGKVSGDFGNYSAHRNWGRFYLSVSHATFYCGVKRNGFQQVVAAAGFKGVKFLAVTIGGRETKMRRRPQLQVHFNLANRNGELPHEVRTSYAHDVTRRVELFISISEGG